MKFEGMRRSKTLQPAVATAGAESGSLIPGGG
jgi:hypothetical protein